MTTLAKIKQSIGQYSNFCNKKSNLYVYDEYQRQCSIIITADKIVMVLYKKFSCQGMRQLPQVDFH